MEPSSPKTGLAALTAIVAALTATFLWLSMLAGPWSLATGLLGASNHFAEAEKTLAAGKMKAARYETLAGVASARRARDGHRDGGPLLDVAAAIPKLGPAMRELDHLIRAAELTGRAAEGTLDIAQNALRGPDRVVAKDPDDNEGGHLIRLERVQEIGTTIGEVRDAIDELRRELRAVEPANLPRRVRTEIRDGIDKAVETDALLADAEAGFEILPDLLGANGTRNYFFGMQNSAEQRGPGGALLQFAILTIADGKPKLIDSDTIYQIDRNRETLDIPLPEDAWYVQAIEDAQRFGNANWSPDWPLSARLTIDYAKASKPNFPDMDGVISVDPILMKKLMPGVGRFRTSNLNVYVTANRVVHYLLYKAYASYPIPKVRRNHLRAVVDDFFVNLFKPNHPSELIEGFGSTLREKHMQVYMTRPREQRFIERMDWDGAIDAEAKGDYLFFVEQNVGGNKLDYFTEHANRVNVQFDGDDAAVTAEVEIANNVFFPQPLYPMGDSGTEVETNGYHRPMMNVYVPRGARLKLAEVTGRGVDRIDSPPGAANWTPDGRPAEHFEKGRKVWTATMEIPPRRSGAFRLGYVVPDAVFERRGRRVYRLTVQRQPRVRTEQLSVRITLPAGAQGVRAKGFERDGNELVWERPLKEDTVLEVSWRS